MTPGADGTTSATAGAYRAFARQAAGYDELARTYRAAVAFAACLTW